MTFLLINIALQTAFINVLCLVTALCIVIWFLLDSFMWLRPTYFYIRLNSLQLL